jgi:DNA-binding Xre family transcriptional regulator
LDDKKQTISYLPSSVFDGLTIKSRREMRKRGGVMIRLRVKEVASQKRMSQGRLSRESNIDINTVRDILRDPSKNITLQTLDRLARALGVDARELIEYSSDAETSPL